ncbi:MAG: hypothetical protein UU16_C0009G0005 [Candidatus Woesebacteria bacterium GW2011_GWA2_40_7]|uniref:Oxidized purine nucleoside triphosphate hydrolase n=3 Tax=Candidatus Woeseibacteriota TaxID=1752722 RepID=A0A0G0PRB5_9BACT|nr:MAG: hypothetical protein UT17_C0004G0269 [Candidatus Woesebacteria bacterium GW2011_GWB1_39_10]KKR73935.1 MAG: hypothetical protein UU16_C0009G0005 [Candidatus Woesebacteria bacterium GW2011_GWA2_40_7]KKS90912.1 MAG: hypothetical protein UV66_C0001G0269 [Candidatus Woesebacteria bacterium GW2011_GWA1_43_12]
MDNNKKFTEIKSEHLNNPLRQATLIFLVKDGLVLLAMKKRGFAEGKWNGSGGKPKPEDKTIEATARREMFEETMVSPKKLKRVAVLNFFFLKKQDWNQQVIVFITNEWTGIPRETEEMSPRWFKINEIPYEEMWEDDALWLPKVLNGKIVEGNFLFDENQKMQEYEVTEVA